MKNVLLLYPYTNDLFSGVGGVLPPLGLNYLDAFLKSKGVNSRVIDCTGQGLTHEGVIKTIREEKPGFVGISAMTAFIHRAIELALMIKGIDERIVVILGGSHVSSLGEDVLRQTKAVDITVRGEGEATLWDIVRAFRQNRSPDLDSILGISFRKEGRIVTTADRPPIRDMDSIPLCTRDASNNYKYHLPVKWDFREPFAAIVSSRGCKYSCAFCDVHKTFGREVRYRSVKNIIEEIAYLKERFKVKDIIFYDDTLTIDRERVIGLCRAIIDNNLSISWGCYSRVDALDEELVLSMKSAGCRMISFGVESGSQEMLKLMKKGIKLESALSAVALCNRCGIQTAASFVIGFPGETKETISETRSFVKKLDPLFATFFRFIPYPGTVFYQEYLKQENMDCMKIEDFQELGRSRILKVPGITEDEVNKSIRGIYLGFYFRPRKLIQHVFRLLRSPKLLGGYVKSLWWACTMRFKI